MALTFEDYTKPIYSANPIIRPEHTEYIASYDSCGLYLGGPEYIPDCVSQRPYCLFEPVNTLASTKWTLVYILNIATYAFLLLCTFFICFTVVAWPIGCLGYLGHCLGFCAHLATLIVTGVFRFNQSGEECAANTKSIQLSGDPNDFFTYSSHGEIIMAVFITGCVLLCLFNCCILGMMTGFETLRSVRLGVYGSVTRINQ